MGEHVRVNMSGKEFIEWKSNKKIFSNKTNKVLFKALPYFIIAVCIGIGGSIIYYISFPVPSTPIFNGWYTSLPSILKLDFVTMLKFGVAYVFPWIAACIGISWVIHGVGFKIIER